MLPPLRERKDDIPLLLQHFVRKFGARHGKSINHISDDVLDVLKRHNWPGNIRELQNFIERAVIMTTGAVLRPPLAELSRREVSSVPPRTMADAERAHIMAILQETNWVVGGRNGAAARLGLPRTTLIARMQRLGISRDVCGHREEEPDRLFATVPSMYSHAPDGHQQGDYAYGRASSRFGNDSTAREHGDARLARAAGF
jgi:DNA-binding NtrC family response regulator